jgi:hypothetical protein
LRCPCIPRKGTSFELVQNNIPVLWYGLDRDENTWQQAIQDTFPTIMHIMTTVSHGIKRFVTNVDKNDAEFNKFKTDISNVVVSVLSKISANVKILSNLQTSIKLLMDTNQNIITDIQSLLTNYQCLHASGTLETRNEKHKCSCGLKFRLKSEFTKHAKTCIVHI